MPIGLRFIKMTRWVDDDPAWLPTGDAPADAVTDLKTGANQLSVYMVEDDQSNLDRILAAFASTRPEVREIEFALFDFDELTKSFAVRKTRGDTPDQIVNEQWHHDVVELSGHKLTDLVRLIRADKRFRTKYKEEVRTLIRNARDEGYISHLNKGIKKSLDS